MNTFRVEAIETRLENALRDIGILKSRLAAAEQRAASGGSGFPNNGSGGGAYYADPGSTVVGAGDSESIEVFEILLGGDVSLGTKTVVNKHSEGTLPDLRIFLTRTRDGAFSVDNQDCPEAP